MIYGQQDFFSSNLVGRIFFYSSARIFFYYICAACNFFLPTSASRKFFFKITHPLPQELNGRPLMEHYRNDLLYLLRINSLLIRQNHFSIIKINHFFLKCVPIPIII